MSIEWAVAASVSVYVKSLAKCLNSRGESSVIVLPEIDLITFSSVWLEKWSVEAITMASPATQSTSSYKVIVDSPASTVVSIIVQVGVLGIPCISNIPFLIAITLFP